MSAVVRDLTIEQGVTWNHAWRIKLDGADLDPAAHWAARSQVRKKRGSDETLHEFTARVVGSVVQLSVQPDESSDWDWKRGVYDIELYDQSTPQRVVRIVQGAVIVSQEVTRERE